MPPTRENPERRRREQRRKEKQKNTVMHKCKQQKEKSRGDAKIIPLMSK